MDLSGKLSEFAKTKEVEFRRILDDIKADVENKQVVCQGMLKSHDVIKSEQLLPTELEVDEVYRQNVESVLKVYSKVLEYIDDSASQLADAVYWGDQLYRLNPNRPYKEYEKEVAKCYSNIARNFEDLIYLMIHFCKILIDIADDDRCKSMDQSGNAFVMVNTLLKFVMPLDEFLKILDQTLKNVKTRDDVAKDPNDNSGQQASAQLKERAKEMIDLDYKIKAANGPLLEALVNCHTITDELRKEFYSFMKDYYNIGISNNLRLIPLKLCSNDLDDVVTSEDLIAYRQEMKEFRDKVWTFFKTIVQTIWDKLQQN